ncbi:hypothetical protein [Demequina phytophila]|uniref:hypothetical protein n=1 Tax=Demequina phytophila TaxID=1638981 RepID=UPI0007809B1A|nr:hypothetical protein [Demequina phytophila]
MTVSVGYSAEEIRELVYEYALVAYGSKEAWLQEHGISSWTMRRWREAVYEGDIARGLIPREGSRMTVPPGERRALEQRRAKERADHAAETERLRARVRELEAANDALGKVIGLLHAMSEHEPDESTPPTSTPSEEPTDS